MVFIPKFLLVGAQKIVLLKIITIMKKQLLLTLALVAACITAEAQKTDTARMLVHYKFSWIQDTTNQANPYTENMVLYIGKSAGAYRSYDAVVYKAQFKKAW